MNICVVGDSSTVAAFELIGLSGWVVESEREVDALLDELARGKEDKLVLLQSTWAARLSSDQLNQLAHGSRCLVLEIPGVGESSPDPAGLLRIVRGAIGVVG